MLKSSTLLDFFSGLFVLIASSIGTYIVGQSEIDVAGSTYGPTFFPSLIMWLLVLFSFLLFSKSLYILLSQNESVFSARLWSFNHRVVLKSLAFVGITIAYAYAFNGLGFFVSTVPLLICLQLLYGNRNILSVMLLSIIAPVILYFVFDRLFNIPLTTLIPWL